MSRADQLLDELIEKLRSTKSVRAIWLAGSRGRGSNDDLSDIDIWIALDDDHIGSAVSDPLAFVQSFTPTVMHILAPSIAPAGGVFLGSWVPVDDEFVQVDWYIARASTAMRDADTVVVFGDVPLREPRGRPQHLAEYVLEKAQQNLALALQSISNMTKNARRGEFWDAANNARNGNIRLLTARSLLQSGVEPKFLASQESLLAGPPPTTVHEVQSQALSLLDEVSVLNRAAEAKLEPAIVAMGNVVRNWRDTGWKPTEEYYRTLPRRYMGAGMLFTDSANNILLLETTYKEFYEIPGGVVESGESPREAARREIQEELGIQVDPGAMLIVDTRSQPAPKGDAIMIVYDGGIIEDPAALQPDGDEIAQVRLTPVDQLDQVCTPQMATRLRAAIRARELGTTIEIVDGLVLD